MRLKYVYYCYPLKIILIILLFVNLYQLLYFCVISSICILYTYMHNLFIFLNICKTHISVICKDLGLLVPL